MAGAASQFTDAALMMIRVEPVRSVAFAEQAGEVLREAWPPTSLHYTASYLAWQFSFPGAGALGGAAAFDGTTAVGFAGATCRRVRHRGVLSDVAVVSFVAVRPGWRGSGVASRLYDVLLDELRRQPLPIVTFAVEGSAGEARLLVAYERNGFRVRPVGRYFGHGYLPRPTPIDGGYTAVAWSGGRFPDLEPDEQDDRGGETVWSSAGPEQAAHFDRDPRRRALAIVRDAAGTSVGSAWVVRSQFVTPQGVTTMTTLENVHLRVAARGALEALLRFAACFDRDPGSSAAPGSLPLMVPNVWGIESSLLPLVGLRRMPSVYRCYLCSTPGAEVFPAAAGTNLEIV